MGLPTPDDNLKAYEESDVCKYPENFKGKQFYLIHGTADDNVHYQQSLMLAKALEGADVLFRQQVSKVLRYLTIERKFYSLPFLWFFTELHRWKSQHW